MSGPKASLRHRAVGTILAVLAVAAMIAAAISVTMYQAVLDRYARHKGEAAVAHFSEKLHGIGLVWADRLMREKARLEFSRLLEEPPPLRWDRLRAYLASLSASPTYAGMAISTADGRELFRHGPGIGGSWPVPDAKRGEARSYFADAGGHLFVALSAPIWLGQDGMGTMHLLVPLDNGFLRQNAFPDSELFLEWQGRIVAGSEGDGALARALPNFNGSVSRDGRRHEQRKVAFPEGGDAPVLLVQTHVAPPFSVGESAGLGIAIFLILALLLASATRSWLLRLLPRIEKLGRAAQLYAAEGKPTPTLDAALQQAAGSEADELSEVAHAMKDMVAAMALRERERQAADNRLRESERLFRDVAEFAGEFVWEIDARQVLTYVSDSAAAVFGRPADKLRGSDFLSHLPAEERESLMERVRRVALNGEPFRRFEVTILRPDGRRRRLSFSGIPVVNGDGQRTGAYRGTAEDITQRKRDERSLRLAEKVFDNSGQAIMITDAAATILSVNPAFTEITGYPAEEAVGRNPSVFASGRHDAAFYAAMWNELKRSGAWEGEIWDRRKNGEVYPKWASINAVNDPESGAVTHYIAIFSDITERKENEARIEHLAYHDALTGLPNRFALQARLAQSLADARRNGTQVALMFIALDHFKTINDSLGHDIGDQLLMTVARRISATLRESDTVARLGGDEFVIVVPGVGSPEDAARVAEKVIEHVGEPLALAGHKLHTSPSIGIGIFPTDGHNAETLMKNADIAMYYAKQHGRNAYRFFTADMNAVATERLMLETQLRAALDRNQISLVYQPQIHLATGIIVGVEALARWNHPERGLVMPETFIPVAEETGLIIPLGAWVIEEACRQAVAWRAAGMPPLRVSVNLSPHQFRDHALARHVGEILERTGLPADNLELELTESAMTSNTEHVIETLRALRDLGVHIAVDDFGAGYSSLAYLKRLPIDRLKIDRSFVSDMEQNANGVAIANGIVALATTLGLSVTAEGIETPAQLEILRSFECTDGQGFLFSRPLPA
ncbi:partial putative signaling protein, partial [Rhodocyclaceae bacterium]